MAQVIKHAHISCCSYEAHNPDTNYIVYCDPPYKTEHLNRYTAAPKFDHDKFWSIMDTWHDNGALVLVSEFSAPAHWKKLSSVQRPPFREYGAGVTGRWQERLTRRNIVYSMSNPVTDYLEYINDQVGKLSTKGLVRLTEVLDAAELELTKDLAKWTALGKGADRFTPQIYRDALIQIRGTLEHIRGPVAEGIVSVLRHNGVLAAGLATKHLIDEVTTFSAMFEGTVRPIAIEAASVLAEGKNLVYKRFASSANRYAGQVGEDIRKQLAIGVVKGETVDQLTNRLVNLGGPKGVVYTRGLPGAPNAKAELIAEGLFRRYRHYAERLVITETVVVSTGWTKVPCPFFR